MTIAKHLLGRHDQKTHARGAHTGLGATPALSDPLRNTKSRKLFASLWKKENDLTADYIMSRINREEYEGSLGDLKKSPEAKEMSRRVGRGILAGGAVVVAAVMFRPEIKSLAGKVKSVPSSGRNLVKQGKQAKIDRAFKEMIHQPDLIDLRNLEGFGGFGKSEDSDFKKLVVFLQAHDITADDVREYLKAAS